MEPGLPPRIEYGAVPFDVDALTPDPVELFRTWFSQAVASGLPEANAACLCTSDPEQGPDGRIVLMKGYGEGGFSFFTNYESSKGQQLLADPRACMVFWWQPLRRQVRVRGQVQRLSEAESEAYFHSRPRESQLGAWASAQSRPIASRGDLERRLTELAARFEKVEVVPKPEHWGGYRLEPREIEFWQGRDSRLHDRFLYRRQADGSWEYGRLMP